jgi:hypothetical protein
VVNVSDVSYDLSSMSAISKVTTTGEVFMIHHFINTESDANDPVLISNSSSTFPSTPLSKPPYLNWHCQMNIHDISVYDLLRTHKHDLETEVVPDDISTDDSPVAAVDPDNADKGSPPTSLPLGDFCQVLSKQSNQSTKMGHVNYKVSYHTATSEQSLSLIDRGANGGVAGNDVRVIFKTGHRGDIHWTDNHQSTNIDIGTVGRVILTQKGPVIRIMNNYALLNKGCTIQPQVSLNSVRTISMINL